MELKHSVMAVMRIIGPSSNRTFMELKQTDYADESSTIKSSNRTFMELKHIRDTECHQREMF